MTLRCYLNRFMLPGMIIAFALSAVKVMRADTARSIGSARLHATRSTTGGYYQGWPNPTWNYSATGGFRNWAPAPSLNQWKAALLLAPPLSSGTNWQSWLIAQTNATSDESPASAGLENIVQNCHYSEAWTRTVDHVSNNTDYFDVVVLGKDTFVVEQGGGYNFASPTSNFSWPVRTFASGEQYFWYQ